MDPLFPYPTLFRSLPQERAAAWLLSEGQLYAADGRRCTSILYLQHAQDRPSVLSDMRNAALCIWRWSRWVRNPCHQSALRSLSRRSEEHTSELQSLMHNSYAVFCLKHTNTNVNRYKTQNNKTTTIRQ